MTLYILSDPEEYDMMNMINKVNNNVSTHCKSCKYIYYKTINFYLVTYLFINV